MIQLMCDLVNAYNAALYAGGANPASVYAIEKDGELMYRWYRIVGMHTDEYNNIWLEMKALTTTPEHFDTDSPINLGVFETVAMPHELYTLEDIQLMVQALKKMPDNMYRYLPDTCIKDLRNAYSTASMLVDIYHEIAEADNYPDA